MLRPKTQNGLLARAAPPSGNRPTISSGSFRDTILGYFRNGAFGKEAAALANRKNSRAGCFLSRPNRAASISRAYHSQQVQQRCSNRHNRSALLITDTEPNAVAALAVIGLSNTPKDRWRTPAAIGAPSAL